MKLVRILFFYFISFSLAQAQFSAMTLVEEDIFTIKGTENIIHYADRVQLTDNKFVEKAILYNGKNDELQIHPPVSESFICSFWFMTSDLSEKQSLLLHKRADMKQEVLVELIADSSQLMIQQGHGPNAEMLKGAKKSLKPKHWYHVIYAFEEGQANLRIRSSSFRFDALIPMNPVNAQMVTIGNNQQGNAFRGLLSDISVEAYSDARLDKVKRRYNKLESKLYGYHKELEIAAQQKNRAIVEKDSIKVNELEFYVDIWDYDQRDGDVLQVKSGPGCSIFNLKNSSPIAQPTIDVNIESKRKKQTLRILLTNADKPSHLLFSAIDMGFISDLNTAKIKVYTKKESNWDTLNINPTFERNIRVPIVYDPDALPLDKRNNPQVFERAYMDSTASKSQDIFLRVSDFSIADGDALHMKVSHQQAKIQKLAKKYIDVDFVLFKMQDTIKVRAHETKFLSCTAKIEVFAKEGKGGSARKLASYKQKIKKNDVLLIPVSFSPPQRKRHNFAVKDSLLTVYISDPQALDGDSVMVKLDDEKIGNYGLDKNEVKLIDFSLHDKSERSLNFICTHKGSMRQEANLVKVVIKNNDGINLAEYVLQMPDLDDPSQINLKYVRR